MKKLSEDIRRSIYEANFEKSPFNCCELGGIIEPNQLVKILANNTFVFPNGEVGFMFEEAKIFEHHEYFYSLEEKAKEFIEALQKLANSKSAEMYVRNFEAILKMNVNFVAEAKNGQILDV